MSNTVPKKDDFDATKAIIEALEPFDSKDRDRIIRWACEKLGMRPSFQISPSSINTDTNSSQPSFTPGGQQQQGKDIKSFLAEKAPKSNNQLAAAVAYYYQFEAPINERKNQITKEDLVTACRLASLTRLNKPEQTLVNAHNVGLLNKGSENGSYTLNSVGENLVAMTMPTGAISSSGQTKKRFSKSTKKLAKKTGGKKK